MNARQEWLTRRQSGIGGSDVAAILGMSPWKTPLDVYLSKVQPITDEAADDMSEAALWGALLEDVVAREAARRNAYQIQRINGLAVHPRHACLIANLDRVIVAPGTRARLTPTGGLAGAAGIMEVKTASAYKAGEWGRPDDEEAIPIAYAAQAMHYLAVTGQDWCEFAVLIGGQKFISKRLERDEQTIAGITDKCLEFWEQHVMPRRPPEPINSADVLKLFPKDNTLAIDANANALEALSQARALKEQIRALDTELDRHVETLKLALGPNAALTLDGKPIVTWKKAADGKATDWKAALDSLRGIWVTDAEVDGAIARATTTTTGSRRFLFK